MGDLVNETTPLLSGNGQALLETLDVSHSATTSSRNHGLESSDDDLLPDQNKYRSMSMASSELPDSGQSPQDWQYQEVGPDEQTLAQACVFIEDAIHYRAIHHRVDARSIKLYRVFFSTPVRWDFSLIMLICTMPPVDSLVLVSLIIFILHLLAFIETPSSLTFTADLRKKQKAYELPCGVTEGIEVVCLLILLLDCVAKSYFKGLRQTLRDMWLLAYAFVLLVSFVDWFVSIGLGCPYIIRIRRMLRPFFILQHSPLMKKTVKSLRRTIPQIASVLLLLFIHLYFFTLFGMLLFPKDHIFRNRTHIDSGGGVNDNPDYNEYQSYFANMSDAFINMLVLLTTANNPDVVLPAYNVNRIYSIFFITFLVIGLYCLMNMLTAVIYNQFRGYFMNSLQASLFRRRLGVRATFEVLRRRRVALNFRTPFDTVSQGVPTEHLRVAVQNARISQLEKTRLICAIEKTPRTMLTDLHFFEIFASLDNSEIDKTIPEVREISHRFPQFLQKIIIHRYFTYFSCLVAFGNVIAITVELATEYEHVRNSSNTYLGMVNMVTIPYYLFENCLTIWALGWKRFSYHTGNLFDLLVTTCLVIIQGVYLVLYGIPYWGQKTIIHGDISLWDIVRIINMLILIKLVRIITTQFKAMFVVTSTLYDLFRNLKAFAGLLLVAFYSYALLGMVLFSKVIKYGDESKVNQTQMAEKCGTYEQLGYWANNFDDFASSVFVLWNVMIVNNWMVFLHAYSRYTSKWSQLYFIVWWLITVVTALNLFTALILENFITRWDRSQKRRDEAVHRLHHQDNLTMHDLFREELQEPSLDSLMIEIRQHPHLSFQDYRGT